MNDQPVPLWLWRLAAWIFGSTVVAVAGLATALSFGLADPPRAGPLQWSDDFSAGTARWELQASKGASLTATAGGLLADFTAADQWAAALTSAPAGDFTLEVGGAQTAGEIGARYGLTFAWRDAMQYNVALINGNGYAEAYRLADGERHDWYEWQQWPHILVGTDANRIRVDVRGDQLTVRVNDEVVVRAAGVDHAGRLGLLTRSVGSGRVVFNWAKVWAP